MSAITVKEVTIACVTMDTLLRKMDILASVSRVLTTELDSVTGFGSFIFRLLLRQM